MLNTGKFPTGNRMLVTGAPNITLRYYKYRPRVLQISPSGTGPAGHIWVLGYFLASLMDFMHMCILSALIQYNHNVVTLHTVLTME